MGPNSDGIIVIQEILESWGHGVKKSRSHGVSKVILEMSKVYPIITDSVRVDRRRVYDNDDRQTNTMTFVLLEAADLQSPLNTIHKLT